MVCLFEIICIGNELLIGKILNTNAQWLSQRITSIGGSIKRLNVVGDVLDEISSILKESISRKPNFIIITGGLGPTFDDMTIEAIGKAFGRPLKLNEVAYRMIKAKYDLYENVTSKKFEINKVRLKMAIIPENAEPLQNSVGTAPGVLINQENVKVIALPGVPNEMMAIFEECVIPLIKDCIGQVFYLETSMIIEGIMESEMVPIIDKIMYDHPYIYIKSHPKTSEPIPIIEIHISTTLESEEIAKKRLGNVVEQTINLMSKSGVKIEKIF